MIYWVVMVELNMFDMFFIVFILYFLIDFLFSERKVDKK